MGNDARYFFRKLVAFKKRKNLEANQAKASVFLKIEAFKLLEVFISKVLKLI
jgi:hypothetical protein